MANNVNFDQSKALNGLETLYKAVAPSLGPRAFTVGLDEGFRRRIIDDGVEIAKRIILEDKDENFGANIVTEAARKTADEAGDSTTATIILAHAIIHESLKLIQTGVHPMALRVGLEEGVELLVKEVDKIKTPVKGVDQTIQIATISCKDPKLGELVARTIDEMGLDGIVTVEESTASETYVEYQKGMRFESGYASKGFVTHPEQMESIYHNPKILIMDKCPSYQTLTPIFTEVKKQQLPLVIIAPEIDPELKAFLIANKANPQSPFLSLCINAPYASNFQKDFLQDLAILTGSTYIALTEGARIEDIAFSDLGECEKIISSHNSTLIVDGRGEKSVIDSRIKSIKALIKNTPSDFDSEKLRERLAKLTSGVAIIKIGGSTEVEMQERKERAIDAVAATKAALEDGIVIGGERAYFQIMNALEDTTDANKILLKSIQKPFEQLLTNSGLDIGMYKERLNSGYKLEKKYIFSKDSGLTAKDLQQINMNDPEQYIIVEGDPNMAVVEIGEKKIKKSTIPNQGIDVTTGEVVNMIEKGIIDPAKVVKSALRNAVSVAIQFITLNAIITPGNEKPNMPSVQK